MSRRLPQLLAAPVVSSGLGFAAAGVLHTYLALPVSRTGILFAGSARAAAAWVVMRRLVSPAFGSLTPGLWGAIGVGCLAAAVIVVLGWISTRSSLENGW